MTNVILSPVIIYMSAETLHHPLVTTPVLWPGEHVVVARVMDAADGLAVLSDGSSTRFCSVHSKRYLADLEPKHRLCCIYSDEIVVFYLAQSLFGSFTLFSMEAPGMK